MTYRSKTYIAADWDEDRNLVEMLHAWNDDKRFSLSFPDAHEITQARDTSKACSIKKSLSKRLGESKTFVLVVGEKTNRLRKGSCQYCESYDGFCRRGNWPSTKSFIEYECDYAVRNDLRIVVLYNGPSVERELCPEIIRYRGRHLPAWRYDSGDRHCHWDYLAIKEAIEG